MSSLVGFLAHSLLQINKYTNMRVDCVHGCSDYRVRPFVYDKFETGAANRLHRHEQVEQMAPNYSYYSWATRTQAETNMNRRISHGNVCQLIHIGRCIVVRPSTQFPRTTGRSFLVTMGMNHFCYIESICNRIQLVSGPHPSRDSLSESVFFHMHFRVVVPFGEQALGRP